MNMLERARELAVKWHEGQLYGDHPYTKHLDDVAELVKGYGSTAVVVAYLHDVLEDTACPQSEIVDQFGYDVLRLVETVTDPKTGSRRMRKSAVNRRLKAIDEYGPNGLCLIVKAADRLANVRECVRTGSSLLDMYRDEHAAFVLAVHRPNWGEELLIETTQLLFGGA